MSTITLITTNDPINKTHRIIDGKLDTKSNAVINNFGGIPLPTESLYDLAEVLNTLGANDAIILGHNKHTKKHFNGTTAKSADEVTNFSRTKNC